MPKTKTIQSLIDEALKTRGKYGAARVERAADEIKNLEKLYDPSALRQAFLSQSGVASIPPQDFAKFAYGLEPTEGRKRYVDYLKTLKPFFDVPYLNIEKTRKGPRISEHEGRHRSLALESEKQPASLIRVYPEGSLVPGNPMMMTQEEIIEAMRRELGEDRLVIPQDDTFPEQFPDIYKDGGPVHLNGGGNPIDEAIKQAKITGPAGRPIRQAVPVDIDQMRRELEQAAAETAALKARREREKIEAMPPAEMKPYDPTIRQRLAEAVTKGLRSVSPAPRARAISDILTGGVTGGVGVADVAPFIGAAMAGEEAARGAQEAIEQGNYGEAALHAGIGALSTLPGLPATARAAKPIVRHAGKMIDEAMITGQGPLAGGLSAILPRRIDAWHGSPHLFPPTKRNPLGEFDPSKIGTGEGNQAFGYGHYLAERQGTSKTYKRMESEYKRMTQGFEPKVEYAYDLMSKGLDDAKVLDNFAYKYGSDLSFDDAMKAIKEAREHINAGYLYRVDLPDEMIPKMLDWDKPLSEQPEVIKALKGTDYEVGMSQKDAEKLADMRLRQEADEWADMTGGDPVDYINNADWEKYVDQVRKESGSVDSSITGKDLHRMVMRDEGYRPDLFDPENYQIGTSEALRSYGIPGIKYLDQSSRQAGEGTRNFVVFPGEEQSLTIKERMKKGGAVSMDAMRMAVMDKAQRKKWGGKMRPIEEAKKALEAAQKTRAKAAQVEAGLYHPIGGGVKMNIPVELMQAGTKEDKSIKTLPKKVITIEDMQGGIAIPLIGDRAAAGRILTDIGGQRLIDPVTLEGGGDYMRTHTIPGSDQSSVWASGKGVISGLGKQVRIAAEYGKPVYGVNVVGSPTMVDFNTMLSEAILGQYDPKSLTKKAKKEFLRELKNFAPDPSKPHLKPGSVITAADLDDPALLREKLLASGAGELRKAFAGRMNLAPFQEAGFPNVAEARFAITEPELVNAPLGTAGYTIGKLDPEGRMLENTVREHKTYPFGLAGEYYGSLDNPVNYTDIFRDFYDKRRVMGKADRSDWRSFGMSPQFQEIDQEIVDYIMSKSKKPREWKKGGAVSIEQMKRELANPNKKAQRKAEGGITSDDLIIEERAL